MAVILVLNDNVIGQQRAYLKALKEIGVKGFRIDEAKHMTLSLAARLMMQQPPYGQFH